MIVLLSESIIFILFFNFIVNSCAEEVICYFGSWAKNRPSNGKFTIEDIEPKYCSIIIYCCIGLNEDSTIKPYEAKSDLMKYISLKNLNSNVKLLTAIGGPNELSMTYSTMAASVELRSTFIEAIVDFLKQHKLDGLDFMWEYPSRHGGSPNDKENFVKLLQMLRKKFKEHNWLLTAAVGAAESLIESSYDVIELNKVLDYFNVKTFDYYSSSDPFVYVHSPLFTPENDPNRLPLTQNGTIMHWLEAGADRAKIILGLAAYGRSFILTNQHHNELMASAAGPGPAGPYSAEEGMLTYLEICEKMKNEDYNQQYHNDIHAISVYKGEEWIGFDNLVSIEAKTNYAKQNRLGGVMLYWIDGDDKSAICGDKKFPLLEAIRTVYPIPANLPTTTQSSSTSFTSKPTNFISKEKAKVMCLLRKHGSSFGNPINTCTNRYYRCLRIMIDDFFARDAKCHNPLVFDELKRKCNHRQYVEACND